jgi:hypothetical protein
MLARALITDALRAIRVIAPGDEPHVDDLNTGLGMLAALILDIHDGRGPLTDVDVTAPSVVAGENQRLRIQAGDTATVTLPNAVPTYVRYNPNDYGFSAPSPVAPQGTVAPADGVQFRQPRDGSRIEIVGTAQALYFYRADINMWIAASGLTLASECPLNARYNHALTALLAESLATVFPDAQLSPLMLARIARGRATIFTQTGTARDPVRAEYF